MLKIGTILWRSVVGDALINVEPNFNEGSGDYVYRIDLDSSSEPQLVSGSERGIVAIAQRQPSSESWTHAVVTGMSKDRTLAFIRFGYDNNSAGYLAFRKKLDEYLTMGQPTEMVIYEGMEPGFRRIKEPMLEIVYV